MKGNPFRTPGNTRVVNATFSPYWSQSGEELLRAWQVRYGQKADGVIAIDLQALAKLMNFTGPVDVPGLGELNSGNLVQVLAGSYDTYNDPVKRQALNASVVPLFRQKIFEDGQLAQKFQMLVDVAQGRHFAMYFRDHRLQDAFEHRDLAGDLSATDHDYVGVFTQNINESKADYWQHRTIASDVQLAPDGSADVTLTVTLENVSPPWVHGDPPDPSQDPRFGYYTRWAGNSVAVFLPRGAEVKGQATMRNLPFKPVVRSVNDRPYFYRKVLMQPGGQAVLTVKYHVPAAATVHGDAMTYGVAIDPQPTVVPESVAVTVHLPDGYGLASTPAGWTVDDDRTLTYTNSALEVSPRLTVHLSKL